MLVSTPIAKGLDSKKHLTFNGTTNAVRSLEASDHSLVFVAVDRSASDEKKIQ